MDDLFAYGFGILYQLPAMGGYGEHWRLDKDEAKQLGASLKACLETIPEERKARVMRKVENVLPWAALIAFGGMTTYVRVKLTQDMMRTQRHQQTFNIQDARPKVVPNVERETTETAFPSANQPGGTFSGGKSIPAPFVVPE